MPKTVTLSDSDLAALHAIRQVVADTPHPARPVAIAALDRIAAAPEDGTVLSGYVQPLDLSQPDGHRCSALEWPERWSDTVARIPAEQDLRLELKRSTSDVPLLVWHMGAGADHWRDLYRLSVSAFTRPSPVR